MQFLLETVFSVLDISTSFIYSLLGRELDANDKRLISYLFSLNQQPSNKNSLKSVQYAIEIISSLNRGKDLLLVTNDDNQNILQLCIINQHFVIMSELLEYGSDANRGSSILRPPIAVVSTTTMAKRSRSIHALNSKTDTNRKSESKDDLSQHKRPQHQQQQQSDNTTTNTNYSLFNLPKTSIYTPKSNCNCSDNDLATSSSTHAIGTVCIYDTPLLLACCLYNRENIDYLANRLSEEVESTPVLSEKVAIIDQVIRKRNTTSRAYTTSLTDYESIELSENRDEASTTFSTTESSILTSESSYNPDDDDVDDNSGDDVYPHLTHCDIIYGSIPDVQDKVRYDQACPCTDNQAKKHLSSLGTSIIDNLLKHGADKHQPAYISDNTHKYLNKKTKHLLTTFSKYTKTHEITPLQACICFDDVELFAKLYKYELNLFTVMLKSHGAHNQVQHERDNDQFNEYIYYAVCMKSHKCLTYLLDQMKTNNARITQKILFNIVQNTRSIKLINILIKSQHKNLLQFDFQTNDSILHTLFQQPDDGIGHVKEPYELSRLLKALLDQTNISIFMNHANKMGELCVQKLFEWNQLVDVCFFDSVADTVHGQKKWQYEMKQCLRLLIDNGLKVNAQTGVYDNCALCLISCLISRSTVKTNKNKIFLSGYLHEILCLIMVNRGGSNTANFNLTGKLVELLVNIRLDDFDLMLKTFKLVCELEMPIKLTVNHVKRLLYVYLCEPNFLSSSKQYDKLEFIKMLVKCFLLHGLEPNETSIKFIDNCFTSNNLLYNLLQLLFNVCHACYQFECLYDILVICVQYGANPNIEPYEFNSQPNKTNFFLTQLLFGMQTPSTGTFNSLRKRYSQPNHNHLYEKQLSSTSSYHAIVPPSSASHHTPNPQQPYLHYYKRFIKFFYDYIDDKTIVDCLRQTDTNQCYPCTNHCDITGSRHYSSPGAHQLQRSYTSANLNGSHRPSSISNETNTELSNELLSYLEKMCTNPRTLLSLTRRTILRRTKKPTSYAIARLPLPDRVKDFLMFNDSDSY